MYPEIDPTIFSLNFFGVEFALRYYSLSYIVGIMIAWWIILKVSINRRVWPNHQILLNSRSVEDLIFYLALGIIIGGRVGYILFYQPQVIINNPIFIIQIWKGGMSFHDGFIGVVVSGILFAYTRNIPVLILGDIIAASSPPGIFLGRLANFINGELWGKPTLSNFGMVFPSKEAQMCPDNWLTVCTRHPTQLYEAFFEGALLGVFLLFFLFKMKGLNHPGRTISFFLIIYGISRFLIEYFREADLQFITDQNPYGHIMIFSQNMLEYGGLTMGQILCIPMIIVGLTLFSFSTFNNLKK